MLTDTDTCSSQKRHRLHDKSMPRNHPMKTAKHFKVSRLCMNAS